MFATFKFIKLGTHKDVKSLEKTIKEAGMRIGRMSRELMLLHVFNFFRQAENTVELVTATVAELGFSGNTRYDKICARILELGYDLCPAEVGPQLRLQYADQPNRNWLGIAMKPVVDSLGDHYFFYLQCHDGDRWLDATFINHGNAWFPDARFVFVRRK